MALRSLRCDREPDWSARKRDRRAARAADARADGCPHAPRPAREPAPPATRHTHEPRARGAAHRAARPRSIATSGGGGTAGRRRVDTRAASGLWPEPRRAHRARPLVAVRALGHPAGAAGRGAARARRRRRARRGGAASVRHRGAARLVPRPRAPARGRTRPSRRAGRGPYVPRRGRPAHGDGSLRPARDVEPGDDTGGAGVARYVGAVGGPADRWRRRGDRALERLAGRSRADGHRPRATGARGIERGPSAGPARQRRLAVSLTGAMRDGRVAFLLHAHLPFDRHPEHPEFLEERWPFEAITESYLPLLDVLEGQERDAVPARITLSISPTLLAMLDDALPRERYRRHLDALVALADSELRRTAAEPAWHRCAELYHARLTQPRSRFVDRWHEDLVTAFRGFAERGRLELATTAATHAILPLLASVPPTVRAQVAVGLAEHRRHFDRTPDGFWLPECAYEPGLDDVLARAGARWTVLDTHGITLATPQPVHGVYAPVACPSGLAAYGRDPHTATEVWSAESGYPADPWYRDFHRDIGYDLPSELLGPFGAGGNRTPVGLKYHRITGPGPQKAPYDPDRAAERVRAHRSEGRRVGQE